MIHKNRFPRLAHVGLILAIALSFALPASAAWKEKVLYSFQGGTNDGSYPYGSVVFDKQGNLYGVLEFYGPGSCAPQGNACGAVYQLTPPAQKGGAWKETLIYEFQGKGANDGELPAGGLLIDTEGNLYGVTAYGGTGNCTLLGVAAGCGTVFELSPPKQKGGAWTETILYSFPTMKQGYFPWGSLVFDKAGNLYGATSFGGTKGTTCDGFYGGQCGVVFEISPPKNKGGKWKEKVLHNFAGIANGQQTGDGANPNGGLVLDGKGSVYGTTYIGGYNCPHNSNQGCGTAFELKPPTKKGGAWRETVLHHFNRTNSDGGNPLAGMVFDAKRRPYGTTLNGGPEGGGIVFRLTPRPKSTGPWTETVLHAFGNNTFGYDLEAPLVFDSSGNLYSAANTGGGGSAYGNVFRLKPPKRKGQQWGLGVLYDFAGAPDGSNPAAGLIFDKSGNIFGTTQYGGDGISCGSRGCGAVFEVSP